MPDLFAAMEPEPAMAPRAESDRPLADRLRPQVLADLVGQEQLLRPEAPLGADAGARAASVADPVGAARLREDDAGAAAGEGGPASP